ncbi:glycosyltransferase family 2 protein, partial [Priestia megaterium]|uniref:glycosyltransferase family 2 protein n=1 Tax=Priestia megaterium TaxID=1404 RepID=UPI002FFF2F69
MNPTVSVIIPTYNVEAYIKETIQSVLNQTYQNFEIIIVDDCSTDGTVNVIKQFQDTRINLFLNEKNSGPSYSRNKAINLAKGEWIAILDSDDWWDRARLEKMIQMGQDHNVN